MSNPSLLEAAWEGFRVAHIEEHTPSDLLILLEPEAGSAPRCGGCGQPSGLIHERQVRHVRDRDLLDRRVTLAVPLRRVDCLSCGRRCMEQVD